MIKRNPRRTVTATTALVALAVLPAAAGAATFVVNNSTDGFSDANPGDGVCEATVGAGNCNLRAAIQEANAHPGFDVITFDPSITSISIPMQGLAVISDRVLIDGSLPGGGRVYIDGVNGTQNCLQFDSPVGNDVEQPVGAPIEVRNSRVQNLAIGNCSGPAISLNGFGYYVRDNYIGLAADGMEARPNRAEGILISADQSHADVMSDFSLITDVPAPTDSADTIAQYLVGVMPQEIAPSLVLNNLVGANHRYGIRIVSQYAAANVIVGNMVGLAVDGVTPRPNGTGGGSDVHGIGISAPAYYNFIVGNVVAGQSANPNSNGIWVDSPQAFPLPNVISHNWVGVSPVDGSVDLGNSLSGIRVNMARPTDSNPLGLSAIVGPLNRVGYNRGESMPLDSTNAQEGGIFLSGGAQSSSHVRVLGNQVGIVEMPGGGWLPVPNAGHGINVVGRYHEIGDRLHPNTIGHNGGHGVALRGNDLDFGTQVRANLIGVLEDGTPAGNGGTGVRVFSGGHGVRDNTIAFNAAHGVQVSSANAWSVWISENAIHDTAVGRLGIDLDNPANAIDPTGPTGAVVDGSNAAMQYANWQQNAPILGSVQVTDLGAGSWEIAVGYELWSRPAGTYLLELFLNDVDAHEGRRLIGTTTFATGAANVDGWGHATGTLTGVADVDPAGRWLTATVTDLTSADPPPPGQSMAAPVRNTSEFSQPVPVGGVDSVRFVLATAAFSESDGTVSVAVERIGNGNGAASVTVDIGGAGSATPGVDFVATSASLDWADGELGSRPFTLQIIDDGEVESTETIELVLTMPQGAVLAAPTTMMIDILDNDAAGAQAQVRFAVAELVVQENVGTATLQVLREGGSMPVTVNYATISGGTATAGADYVPTSGVLSWAAGDMSSRQITVTIIDDALPEVDETVLVALTDPQGAMLAAPSVATIRIAANDQLLPPEVIPANNRLALLILVLMAGLAGAWLVGRRN